MGGQKTRVEREISEVLDEPYLSEVLEIINKPLDKEKELLLISQYSDKILYLIRHKGKMPNTDIQGAAEAIIRMVLLDAQRA
jgi:hypothetical protein